MAIALGFSESESASSELYLRAALPSHSIRAQAKPYRDYPGGKSTVDLSTLQGRSICFPMGYFCGNDFMVSSEGLPPLQLGWPKPLALCPFAKSRIMLSVW